MKLHTLRRTASAAVVGSVALAGLMAVAPSPAQAAGVESGGSVGAYGGAEYFDGDCTLDDVSGDSSSVDFLDNGAPFARSANRTFSITDDATGQVSTVTSSSTYTAKATPLGTGAAARIDFWFTGSAKLSGSANACEPYGWAGGGADFAFTLPAPMWATLSGGGSGSYGSISASIGAASNAVAVGLTVSPRSSGSATAFLPAGRYVVNSGASATVDGAASTLHSTASFSGSIGIDLKPVGAGAAPVGKGQRFAALGERSCATNSVPVSIKKAAKNKAKSVVLTVNNKKRATFTQNAKPKKRLKARTAVLGGIAPAAPATVSAVITLKNGKKVTVSRTYLPCS